jgi:hypothetical protein
MAQPVAARADHPAVSTPVTSRWQPVAYGCLVQGKRSTHAAARILIEALYSVLEAADATLC